MILTGFADPDKPNLDHAPESERRQNARLSVPPQAPRHLLQDEAWDNGTQPPPSKP